MKLPSLACSVFIGLVVAAAGPGCGDTIGQDCESIEDCSDEEVCTGFVACVTEPCPRLCAASCTSDEECEQGTCSTSSSGDRVCVDSTDPGED